MFTIKNFIIFFTKQASGKTKMTVVVALSQNNDYVPFQSYSNIFKKFKDIVQNLNSTSRCQETPEM